MIRLLLLLSFVLVTGCSSVAHYPAERSPAASQPDSSHTSREPEPQAAPATSTAPGTTAAPVVASVNPAVASLLSLARSQYQAQNYQGAIATAERGLRIDRRAADLYLVLSQSYLQLDQPHKAQMFVQQGLRYAPDGSDTSVSLLRLQRMLGN